MFADRAIVPPVSVSVAEPPVAVIADHTAIVFADDDPVVTVTLVLPFSELTIELTKVVLTPDIAEVLMMISFGSSNHIPPLPALILASMVNV